jgi:hypothetical protein
MLCNGLGILLVQSKPRYFFFGQVLDGADEGRERHPQPAMQGYGPLKSWRTDQSLHGWPCSVAAS